MTIHPAIIVALLALIVLLALAYIGAWTRAMVLQLTVDNLWPIVHALGRAMDVEGAKGKGTSGPA
jgi:hypothetical protein